MRSEIVSIIEAQAQALGLHVIKDFVVNLNKHVQTHPLVVVSPFDVDSIKGGVTQGTRYYTATLYIMQARRLSEDDAIAKWQEAERDAHKIFAALQKAAHTVSNVKMTADECLTQAEEVTLKVEFTVSDAYCYE